MDRDNCLLSMFAKEEMGMEKPMAGFFQIYPVSGRHRNAVNVPDNIANVVQVLATSGGQAVSTIRNAFKKAGLL